MFGVKADDVLALWDNDTPVHSDDGSCSVVLQVESGRASIVVLENIESALPHSTAPTWSRPPHWHTQESVFRRLSSQQSTLRIDHELEHVFLARTVVLPGLDHARFNAWYDEVHLPEIEAAGLISGQRFVREWQSLPGCYLTVYQYASPAIFSAQAMLDVRGFADFESHIDMYERIESRVLRCTCGRFSSR